MYLEHFGLSETPFRITPHTEFFFSGANRGATLDALIYAVINDEGIVKVSGEVGSGKTMLCRVLMERLPPQVDMVYLANPSLSRDDILFSIATDLELPVPENTRTSAIIRLLQTKLIELHGQGRQVVVLIDEAHAMPVETLEEVRLLSNLETSQHKLLQLVMFGQPELDDILSRSDMRQLKERITQNFSLEPLHRDDIAEYLDFRMRTAGYRGPEVFSPAAVKLIASASQGLTRRVNILAEKSLLAAFAEGTHLITPKEVGAAIRDSQYDDPRVLHRKLLIAAGVIAAVVVGVLIIGAMQPNAKIADQPSAAAPTSAATSTVIEVPATPVVAPVTATPPPVSVNNGVAAAPIAVPPRLTFTPPPPTSGHVTPASTAPARESIEQAVAQLGAMAQERVRETQQWIQATDGNRWFIQLVATNTSRLEYAQQFLARADRLLQPQQARLYVADLGKELRIGIIYGDFPNWQAANRAVEQLPPELRTNSPFPRQVLWIK
jgi:type II secretory pathway predicted ATPase ExeA/septal ring-binding cell division protein DamX